MNQKITPVGKMQAWRDSKTLHEEFKKLLPLLAGSDRTNGHQKNKVTISRSSVMDGTAELERLHTKKHNPYVCYATCFVIGNPYPVT